MMNEFAPSKQLMQKMNRLKVLDVIKRAGRVTRPSLARQTGLSLASITNIVTYLKGKELVLESEGEEESKAGRKAALLEYKYSFYDIVLVNVTAGGISIYLTDLSGAVKKSVERGFDGSSPGASLDGFRSALRGFIEEYASKRTLAVGIAMPGLVLNDGEFVLSALLRREISFLKREVQKDVSFPVVVFNISSSNALFACGAVGSMDLGNVVFIDLDGGVGAIQVCHGRVNRATVGEIGHTTVEKDGELCFCGNRGCLELMCSPSRIVSQAAKAMGKSTAGLSEIFELALGGGAVKEAVDGCLEYLGIAVANIINIFLPEKVIINYVSLNDYGYVHEFVVECVKRRVHHALPGSVLIEKAFVGERDKVPGMAQYVCDTIFDISFPRNIVE